MRFIASFADRVVAKVESINIEFTYKGLIEGWLSAGTRHYLAGIEERIALIEAGRLKGFYCFEPELMDEKEYYGDIDLPFKPGKCLKDNKVSAHLTISEKDAQYSITLEWYSSTRELAGKPLTDIVQEYVGKLRYFDIQMYCKKTGWDDLN